MTFDSCADCGGTLAEMLQVLLLAILLGVPISILLVARSRRQKWCRLGLSASSAMTREAHPAPQPRC